MYSNYGPLQLLLGDFGMVLKELGGTENDALRLLLDNGIVGFAPYGIATWITARKAISSRNLELSLVLLLIVGASLVFPFMQSLPSAILFWIFFFTLKEIWSDSESRSN
jgi:hypothetical protein